MPTAIESLPNHSHFSLIVMLTLSAIWHGAALLRQALGHCQSTVFLFGLANAPTMSLVNCWESRWVTTGSLSFSLNWLLYLQLYGIP
jgi:hypothetical protein